MATGELEIPGDRLPLSVGILIFDEVEVLDFCGPFEVLASASINGEDAESKRCFQVLTVAESANPISCRGGLIVVPNHDFASCPPLDMLVVPGGFGTRRERQNRVLINWLRQRAAAANLVTSVCTGASLLGEAGILDGLRATTHWADIAWLREHYPAIAVLDDQRVVDEGRVITAAGVSAGIDMALYVVGRLFGEATAANTARDMEYDHYRPSAYARSPH